MDLPTLLIQTAACSHIASLIGPSRPRTSGKEFAKQNCENTVRDISPITSQAKYMKPAALFIFAAMAVRAADPKTEDAVDKAAALKAATAWLGLLDKPDFVAAGAGGGGGISPQER
jgi:hypothetical protein